MKRSFILQALFMIVTTILANATLSAQDTLMVTNTNDSGTGSLRQAVADASSTGNSTIIFSDEIFFDTIKVNSYITLDKNLTILGPGPDTLAISGENSTQVFQINKNGRYFSISDLTFTKSTSSAIKVIEGYLSINDCNFINNSSSYGGALYVMENCNLTLNNCLFSQNKASNMGGGAIYLGYWTGNVYINNCTFTDNEFTDNTNGGGAVYINGPTVYFEGCTFSGNISAKNGGAIYSINVHTHITNCIFTNNSANGGGGGGGAIYSYKKALTCKNCIFTSNSANSIGGAIYNHGYNGSPYIKNDVSLINCSFTGNHSDNKGGAIYNYYSTGEIINCIISGNTATYNNNEMFSSSSINIDISYNCINECYDDNGNWDSELGSEGTGNIDADPLFISPPANLHIQENSPCIDAGVEEYYTPDTDLEGNLRDENPDIGAYEYCVPPIIDAAWNGNENSDWNNTANWSNTLTPNEYTNVTIPTTLHNPTINNSMSAPAKTNNLTIMAGADLNIQPGKCLTTNGSLTNNGVMILMSDATGTASLITNSDVTGSVEIQKYITDSRWHLIGSPMTSHTAAPFYSDYVQYYAGGEWIEVTNVDDPLYPLVGYSLWDVAKHTTYMLNGTPNTGELSIPVFAANGGWNLLSNPYPSAVDWDMMDDTYGAIYYWDPTAGSYVYWNNSVGSGSQILPAMQGFWINAQVDGTFDINNDARTHSGTDLYYKNSKSKESAPKLELIAFNDSRQDHFHFLFTEDASADFDLQYDAYKMLTNVDDVPQLFSISNGKRYSIDRRPSCESINLGFSCMTSGEFSIMIAENHLIPKAILEDTKTGTFHDLNSGAYEFAYIREDPEDRFILHLSTVGIENMQTDAANIYAYQKQITIANLESNEETLLSVFNTAGAEVLTRTLNGADKHMINTTLPSGIYVAVLRSNSEVIKKKINIQ